MVLGDKFLILILFISFELPRGTHLNRGEFDQLMENWNINFSVSFFYFISNSHFQPFQVIHQIPHSGFSYLFLETAQKYRVCMYQ